MTPRSLELFDHKWQPKVGLIYYDIHFAYFVVEAKAKTTSEPIKLILYFSSMLLTVFSFSKWLVHILTISE